MKKTILILIMLTIIPSAFAMYGGDTWSYHFDKCDSLQVNITGTEEIVDGEYTVLNNCTLNKTNYYVCSCTDGYDFNISFRINTINNYTISFNYDYYKTTTGGSSGGNSHRQSSKEDTEISECNKTEWNCSEWRQTQYDGKVRDCYNDCGSYILDKLSESKEYISVTQSQDLKQTETSLTEPTPLEDKEEESNLNLIIIITSLIIFCGGLIWFLNFRK